MKIGLFEPIIRDPINNDREERRDSESSSSSTQEITHAHFENMNNCYQLHGHLQQIRRSVLN